MVQVRRTLEGRPRQVLHLKTRDLRVEMKTGEDPAGRPAFRSTTPVASGS
jgi:hypothetical protein